MSKSVDEFNDYRAKMNKRILDSDNLVLKDCTTLMRILIWMVPCRCKPKKCLGLLPAWCCAVMIVLSITLFNANKVVLLQNRFMKCLP